MAVLSILLLSLLFSLSHQQPPLDSSEQESVYQILDSLNPAISWRTLFPDDLCLTAPHGVVCDYPTQLNQTPHIVQLSFGYVSDETPNPPCSSNATLHFDLFNSFPYLRKLFFYNCFNHTPLSLSPSFSFPSSLQELVFINNPSFISPLASLLQNLTSLRRLILIGNAFHGHLPSQIASFLNLEHLTLSRNNLSGQIPSTFGLLNQLKLLDLSGNNFQACLPDSLGNLSRLLKLDLSFNAFGCRIPESFRGLQSLEFLDLSFNRFGSFGVPLFLGEVPTLKEVYLSGNSLSGAIPEIWENLGGVERLGLSDMGLVGSIPVSMGVYLKNLSYLGLDNNNLDGPVPFGLLEYGGEINLENNNLSGRVRLSRVRQKLKLKVGGNRGLCLDNIMGCESGGGGGGGGGLGQLKACKKTDVPDAVVFSGASSLLWFDSLSLLVGLGSLAAAAAGVLVFTGF